MKPSELYDALTSDRPVWINGTDFHGLNYGKAYAKMCGGTRKIGFSGKNESYLARTPAEDFPSKIVFNKREPHMSLTEATHVGDYKVLNVPYRLDELVELLKDRLEFE